MANHRSVRYRLFPETGENVRALHGLAGACRYVWNHFLALHQEQYKLYREAQTLGIDGYRKPSVSFFNLGTQFTEFRAGHPWLEQKEFCLLDSCLRRTNRQDSRFARRQPPAGLHPGMDAMSDERGASSYHYL